MIEEILLPHPEKPRLLIISEPPFYEFGYSQVNKYMYEAMADHFSISYLCWGWNGYNPSVYEARTMLGFDAEYYHVVGNRWGLDNIRDIIKSAKPEVILLHADTFMFLQNLASVLKEYKDEICQVLYFPVDGDNFPLDWLPYLKSLDGLICYTEYGREEINRHSNLRLEVVHLGVNTSIFYPVSEGEKRFIKDNELPFLKDKFAITWVGRNFVRKNPQALLRALAIWDQEFGGLPEEVVVYFHTDDKDPAGFPLSEVIVRDFPGLRSKVFFPNKFDLVRGVKPKQLARIYQASDIFVNTSMGEGWGLPITEAMACKVPVIVPSHTACEEQVGTNGERGLRIKNGSTIYVSHNVVQYVINEVDLAAKLKYAYEHREELEEKIETAYDWASKHDWSITTKDLARHVDKFYKMFKNEIPYSSIENL